MYEEQEQASIERLLGLVDGTADPLDQLRTGCRAFLTACLDPTFRRIALVEAPAGLGWEEWREIDARYGFGLLRAGVEAAMEAGRLRRMAVDQVAHLLLAALSEAALLLGRADDPDAAFDEIASTFDRSHPGARGAAYCCCGSGLRIEKWAPPGSLSTANRPTVGMSDGGTLTLPPSSVAARRGRVGVVDREVHHPVRRDLGGPVVADLHRAADRLAVHLQLPVDLASGHRELVGGDPEHRLVELQGGREIT